MKSEIARIQKYLGITPDGVIGPITINALNKALNIPTEPTWPTQAEVRRGNSIFGAPGQETDLVNLSPPYPLYYEGKKVKTIRVHRLIAPHVQSALQEVLEHYGLDEIHRLGLDVYGGSYHYRKNTGGQSLSMHAWGIALDFAPDTNAFNTRAPRASLSHPDCDTWWRIWEKHGAISLGRERGHDWMHLQFARL